MMPRFAYIREMDEIEAEMGMPELGVMDGSQNALSDTNTPQVSHKPCDDVRQCMWPSCPDNPDCVRYAHWQDGVR